MDEAIIGKKIIKLFDTGLYELKDLHEIYEFIVKGNFNINHLNSYLVRNLSTRIIYEFPITFDKMNWLASSCDTDLKVETLKAELETILCTIGYSTFMGEVFPNIGGIFYYVGYMGTLFRKEIIPVFDDLSNLEVYGVDDRLSGVRFCDIELCSNYPYPCKEEDFSYMIPSIYGNLRILNIRTALKHFLLHYDFLLRVGRFYKNFDCSFIKTTIGSSIEGVASELQRNGRAVIYYYNTLANECSSEFQKIYADILKNMDLHLG